MSQHTAVAVRASKSAMRQLQIGGLQWAVGTYCAVLGALMLVAPRQSGALDYAPLQPYLTWWAVASLLAGAVLLIDACLTLRRALVVAAYLVAAGVLLLLAWDSSASDRWAWACNYGILAIGTVLAPFLPGAWERGRGPAGPKLFCVLMGLVAALNGLAVLVSPGQFGTLLSGPNDLWLPWYGGGLLGSGLALLATQASSRLPRAAFRGACLISAGTFFAVMLAATRSDWSSAVLYYGGFGAMLGLLPWLGPYMRRGTRASLQTRLALALACAAALPLIVAVALASDRAEHSAAVDTLALQQNLANSLAGDVASYIGLHASAVAALAAQPGLSDMPAQRQQALLRAARSAYVDIDHFSTFDSDGSGVARSDSLPHAALSASLKGSRVYEDARRSNGPSLDVLGWPLFTHPVLVFGAPIRDSVGAFAGLVTAVVEPKRLSAFLAAADASGSEKAFVVDEHGRIIAHPDTSLVGSSASLSHVPPVAALLAGAKGPGSMGYHGPTGEMLAGWARVPGVGWGVVMERSAGSALEGVRAGRDLAFGVLVLVIVAAAILGVMAAGRLSAPLAGLARAVDHLVDGDMEVPLPDTRILELERLATAFGQLRDRLAARTQEWQRAEEALTRQALHDVLTDLPNRMLLDIHLQQAITNAQRDNKTLALLIMDLDGFKQINDTLGHHTGDILLQQVAARLVNRLRTSDTVARLGGDEFGVLLPGADAAGAMHAAGVLLSALEKPFVLQDHNSRDIEANVGASVGIAVYPEHGTDVELLMRRADIAMYVAKRGQTGYAIYAPDQAHDNSPDRLTLVGELRSAIEQDALVLQYQPRVSFNGQNTAHVEALVRWRHPARGLVPPDQFVPLAEQVGLIKPLTLWVLNAALRQCHIWREAGLAVQVAVNLSMRNLQDAVLPDAVTKLLRAWKLPASSLAVEITESGIMVDPARAMEILTSLRTLGVQVAIDDFGTGYSSLAHLKRLPVDVLKIDKSFVLNMATDERDLAIVRSTIELGHNLRLEVVAEGVENGATCDLLSALGCDGAQGFYLARPLSPEDTTAWFSERPTLRRLRSAERPTPIGLYEAAATPHRAAVH